MVDLLKKWWLWLLVLTLGVAVGIALILRIGRKDDATTGIVASLDGIRKDKATELAIHAAKVEAEKQEIKAAQAIPDKQKRLQALADIANRRRQ